MNPFNILESCLLDLLYELRETENQLILGGGYGLYLKQRYLHETRASTLLTAYPDARSTNDLDIFLRTEILADAERARLFADALDTLGYIVIESAKYYQFTRDVPVKTNRYSVKLDLLTGPPEPHIAPGSIRMEDPRRVKPGDKTIPLHARLTREAVTVQEEPLEVRLQGQRTNGEKFAASVFLPQAFTYATMKLFAFRDKEARGEVANASKHALDIYLIIAMMTEPEYEMAKRLRAKYDGEPVLKECSEIVRAHFSHQESLGLLRLREHPYFTRDMEPSKLISILKELITD